MFKEMRRKNRELEADKAIEILESGEYLSLATVSEDGYPYSVVLSYAYHEGAIYVHCARTGHKLDNIRYNNKVSFSVVTDTEIIPDKFTTKYKSVVGFGIANEVSGEEKEIGLLKLIDKYSNDFLKEGQIYISKALEVTNVVKIDIQKITGKSNY